MCGIFGVLLGKETGYSSALLINTVDYLFVLSGSRGKEAAGCAIRSEGRLNVYKEPGSARYFIRRRGYRQLLKEVISDTVKCKYTTLINKPIAIIGHTRLATNGSEADNNNNNPIISNVHIFASELPILQRLIKKLRLERVIGKYAISQLKPKQGTLINIHELTEQKFNLDLQNNHRITTIE